MEQSQKTVEKSQFRKDVGNSPHHTEKSRREICYLKIFTRIINGWNLQSKLFRLPKNRLLRHRINGVSRSSCYRNNCIWKPKEAEAITNLSIKCGKSIYLGALAKGNANTWIIDEMYWVGGKGGNDFHVIPNSRQEVLTSALSLVRTTKSLACLTKHAVVSCLMWTGKCTWNY